ncbi:MAG: hypothetical protein QGF28_03340 [Candidatus Thalassarchaeaceae archaeon]|nr:hypothetical protein [Euryarchaeota archaeon]MDP7091350.1 hypothetical protein [Candidatus Thalassarchaeaceae archaeon]MDP7256560.1 hypothetical protein [Candidatus Thalassarchaeaceae archaeon]MDP7446222.1 hypothetical protein [Candidatus Thalassarchaeaceae archaeon]MDP7648689.1 hypothetical protein [Candidatus Thalassarchaeaceae archaeon]|tara:strand:+ start:1494 stop:2075 length:582 start_codon:yes stop_codon:yes gene_type:complete
MTKEVFEGRVISSGFSTGDMMVIGDWDKSPFGPFTDLMWAKPDGTKVLIAPAQEIADYVSSMYSFEEVVVAPLEISRGKRSIEVNCNLGRTAMSWGWSLPLPFRRPLWFIANIEAPFARILFGTKTHGATRNGRKEWYHVRGLSRLISAEIEIEGRASDQMTGSTPGACFGFSNPPRMPLSVRVDSHIAKAES